MKGYITQRKIKQARYCKICGHKLKKSGKHPSGTQRWKCTHCQAYTHFKRKDILEHLWCAKYFEYSFGKKTQSEFGVHRATFIRKIKPFRDKTMYIPQTNEIHNVLYIDGTWVGKGAQRKCYLIARNEKWVVGFALADKECKSSWSKFLSEFKQPQYVVCDGQNGMLRAIASVWPRTHVQRCLIHVLRNIVTKLTTRPESDAGQYLLSIARWLTNIKTVEESQKWISAFRAWEEKYHDFLLEKSQNENSVWDMHYRLVSAALQLRKLIKREHLFAYLNEKNFHVDRTSNPIEGGINSPLKAQIRRHCGMRIINQQKLVELYLLKRSEFWTKIAPCFAT